MEVGDPSNVRLTCGGSPHLTCKRDQLKMRCYLNRWVTHLNRLPHLPAPPPPPPPPCKQALISTERKEYQTEGDYFFSALVVWKHTRNLNGGRNSSHDVGWKCYRFFFSRFCYLVKLPLNFLVSFQRILNRWIHASVAKLQDRYFCWFPATTLCPSKGTPVWRLHTKLYRFG